MRPARLIIGTGLLAVVGLGSARGEPVRIIADTDTLLPDFADVTFSTFGQLNGVDPDISGGNVVFGAAPTGIYGWFDNELITIADLSSTFPGSGNPLGFDLADGSSPAIDGQNVVFYCRNGRPGPGAICTYIGGELGAVAEVGVTLVPGSSVPFKNFHMLGGTSPAISGRNVAFGAIWSGGGYTLRSTARFA